MENISRILCEMEATETGNEDETETSEDSETEAEDADETKNFHQDVLNLLSAGNIEGAVLVCRQAQGDHSDIIAMFNRVAMACRDSRRYNEAAELLREVLRIQERHLGTELPAVATTLNNMAAIHVQRNQHVEAQGLFQRAMKIWEVVGGEEHPEVAMQLVNLALVLQKQGQLLEAIPLLERAAGIHETKLEPTDSRMLNTRNALAGAYIKALRFQEAEEQYKQVLNAVHDHQEGCVIWLAAERSEDDKKRRTESVEEPPQAGVITPAMNRALVDLAALYHLQGKHRAAKVLEDYHSR